MWEGGGVRCAHRESLALRALWGRLLEARRSCRARHAERLCKWGRFIGSAAQVEKRAEARATGVTSDSTGSFDSVPARLRPP